jgi:hypothetical protein
MLGNMQTESYINPGVWQSFREWGSPDSHGYGLVQWTPYTKYTNWCEKNGYDISDIDTALKRIELEVEANAKPGWSELDQWISTSSYNMTFSDFTKSTLPAYDLGRAFLLNYERPGNQSEAHQHTRGKQAESWYNFLLQYSSETAVQVSVKNLKVDVLLPTRVTASFIVQNGKKGYYEIKDSVKTPIDSGNLAVEDTENNIKIVSFSCNHLVPNTSYNISVKIIGTSDADVVEETITFTTPQDLPKTIKKIELKASDEKLPNESFQLTTTRLSDEDWGYWKKPKTGGYAIQLIVNGKVVEEKTKDSLDKIWNFDIDKEFKKYKSKIGDIIQIGIRTWVTDDAGHKIFDSQTAKTSNSICFLKQPLVSYLNI